LICSNANGEVKEIDARTSDAIAMAVRFNCPIYTYEFILSSAGMVLDESEGGEGEEEKTKPKPKKATEKKASSGSEYASLSTDELKESLMRAIDDEAYETASKIRDELNKRKKSTEQ
jgi:bifunctional DNase/RNase